MMMIAQLGRLDRKGDFDPAKKISRHPIGAGEIDFGLPAIFEIIDPAVLEKPADDADDANVIAQARNLRSQTTNPAHDQVDCHFSARRFVKFFDDLLIDQRIEFGDDAGRLACAGIVPLALDLSDQALFHVEWRDHQLFQTGITGKTGQGVEDNCDFFGQSGIAA